ncbi:MAG TPA: hypothetical protein VFG63_10020 [Nocardioidaceae bacterium]|nr:hypothetical protein [Nocardioidaceae bacterium]
MSESKAPARPNQVTMAGWIAVIGSALLVVTLFDSMSQIRSIEMRESIQEFLSTSPGSGLGLDTGQVITILRVLTLFAGAAAAAATVLAVYVLQRNKGARLGFTIAAVAIMCTAPVTGSPFAVLVAFAAVMLWTQPARDWFAGRTSSQRDGGVAASSEHRPPGQDPFAPNPGQYPPDEQPSGERPPGEQPSEPGSAEWPRMPDSSSERPLPPPTEGFGDPAGSPQGGQHQGQHQGPQGQSWPPPAYGQQPQHYAGYPGYSGYPGYGQPVDPDKRPTTVTIAAWLTWISAALTLFAFGLVVVVMIAARDDFVRAMRSEPEFERLNVDTNDIIAAMWVVSAIIVIWCLSAIVLAVLAYRRQNWARITLVVSAGFAALFSLLAITSLVSVITLLTAGATIALLFTGGANQWFSRKRPGYPSYPSAPYGNQYGGPQQSGQYGGQQQGGQQYGGPGDSGTGDRNDPPSNVW